MLLNVWDRDELFPHFAVFLLLVHSPDIENVVTSDQYFSQIAGAVAVNELLSVRQLGEEREGSDRDTVHRPGPTCRFIYPSTDTR